MRAAQAEASANFRSADWSISVATGVCQKLQERYPRRRRVAVGRPWRHCTVLTKVASAMTATGCCGARIL